MKRISDTEYITTIKGYIFIVLKTANGLYYFIPFKNPNHTKNQKEMLENLVSYHRSHYVGKDTNRLVRLIRDYINSYPHNGL